MRKQLRRIAGGLSLTLCGFIALLVSVTFGGIPRGPLDPNSAETQSFVTVLFLGLGEIMVVLGLFVLLDLEGGDTNAAK